jgi:hypothetical protein
MKRLEIIANKSVEEEIINELDADIPDFMYTLIPVVHGKGKSAYRSGTAIWPEENFMLLSYLEDAAAEKAAAAITRLKQTFKGEEIKVFTMSAG